MEDLIRVLCNEDETFDELFRRTKIHLTIVASNITKHCSDFFNKNSYPNMPIFIACLASTAYPLVFSPVSYEGNLYVDGGMTYNIPTDYYKGNGVCFILEDKKIENNDKEDSNGVFSFLHNLYKTLLNASDNSMTNKKVVVIPYSNVNSFDFDVSGKRLDKLVERGYNAISKAQLF